VNHDGSTAPELERDLARLASEGHIVLDDELQQSIEAFDPTVLLGVTPIDLLEQDPGMLRSRLQERRTGSFLAVHIPLVLVVAELEHAESRTALLPTLAHRALLFGVHNNGDKEYARIGLADRLK
jgi:hypothetical protein